MTQATQTADSPKRTTWTREEFEEVSQDFMKRAREVFERDKRHAPMAFLFGTKDPRTGENVAHILPILAQFNTAQEKDMFALTVKMMAWATQAVGLIFISEVWMRFTEASEDTKKMSRKELEEYLLRQKPPSECEDRKEALMLNFEHSRFGVKSCHAEITRDEKGDPSLGEWKWYDKEQVGRFVHLLPTVA